MFPSSLLLGRLQRLAPTFTTAQASAGGIAPRDLYRMRDEELLYEVSRGVFRKATAPDTRHLDLLAVTARAPHAVLCLETALSVHELTDVLPVAVDIAVSRGTHPPRIEFPVTRAHKFVSATFDFEVELMELAEGESVRVYSSARSVVDCVRLRHFVGDTVAFRALREYLRLRAASPGRLLEIAGVLGAYGPIRHALEVVLAY